MDQAVQMSPIPADDDIDPSSVPFNEESLNNPLAVREVFLHFFLGILRDYT